MFQKTLFENKRFWYLPVVGSTAKPVIWRTWNFIGWNIPNFFNIQEIRFLSIATNFKFTSKYSYKDYKNIYKDYKGIPTLYVSGTLQTSGILNWKERVVSCVTRVWTLLIPGNYIW